MSLFENYQKYTLNAFLQSELLTAAFKYYMSHNQSLTVPYHNVNHMLTMAHIVNTMIDDSDLPYFQIEGITDKEALLLCVIFHDFGHSAGKCTDEVNILNAMTGMDTFIKEWNLTHQIEIRKPQPQESNGVFGKIRNFIGIINDIVNPQAPQMVDHINDEIRHKLDEVIRATQYPYLYPTSEIGDNALRIIREADIMVALNQDYFTQCICGLMTEMNVSDVKEMLDKHSSFIIEKLISITYKPFKEIVDDNINDFKKMVDNYKLMF